MNDSSYNGPGATSSSGSSSAGRVNAFNSDNSSADYWNMMGNFAGGNTSGYNNYRPNIAGAAPVPSNAQFNDFNGGNANVSGPYGRGLIGEYDPIVYDPLQELNDRLNASSDPYSWRQWVYRPPEGFPMILTDSFLGDYPQGGANISPSSSPGDPSYLQVPPGSQFGNTSVGNINAPVAGANFNPGSPGAGSIGSFGSPSSVGPPQMTSSPQRRNSLSGSVSLQMQPQTMAIYRARILQQQQQQQQQPQHGLQTMGAMGAMGAMDPGSANQRF